MNALRGNTYLKRLDFGFLDVRTGTFQALVTALHENRELAHHGLTSCTVDDVCWDNLMGAIAEHPSLRTLSFRIIDDANGDWILDRHDPIHALAGMLAENKQIDDIQVETCSDRGLWNEVVVRDLRPICTGSGFLPYIRSRTRRLELQSRLELWLY
jgi:hypothetical protein